jgi:NitT/TauT family transport system substrate-binding protein
MIIATLVPRVASGAALVGAALLVLAGAAPMAGSAPAQTPALHPWKHGIIAPKADAGFLLMAAKGGFAEKEGLKLELLEVKDDQIGLKALLAGELDSYEGGVQGAIAADVRGADVKIVGCHWVVIPHDGQGRD